MLLRNPFLGVAISAGAIAGGLWLAACSSSESPSASANAEAGPASTCTAGGLTIAFNPMYSAFDGTHIFKVPAVVVGSAGTVTWSADSSMVGIQADNERPNEILVQTLKAGVTTLTATSNDGKCGSAQLTITAVAESDWEIGNKRYNNGESVHLQGAAVAGSGSIFERDGTHPACTNCHGETATNSLFVNISHTPEQTGGFSDSDLLNIILHGQFPDGGYFDDTIVNYNAWSAFHQWADIDSMQQKGIIAYLRSLTPIAQKGSVNFGALDDLDAGAQADTGAVVVVTDGASDAGSADATATDGQPASN